MGAEHFSLQGWAGYEDPLPLFFSFLPTLRVLLDEDQNSSHQQESDGEDGENHGTGYPLMIGCF